MVKFSKELEAQLIPGWENAFVNYRRLKKHVKQIKFSSNPKPKKHSSPSFDLAGILFRRRELPGCAEVIKRRIISHGETEEEEEEDEEENSNRDLIHLFTLEDEVQLFFQGLDDELQKVNKFYDAKEAEFIERGDLLNTHLQILIHLKTLVEKNTRPTDRSDVLGVLEKNGVTGVTYWVKKRDKKIALRTETIWGELLNDGEFINRKKIQCAEKMIRNSYVELYKGLSLLRTYSCLNSKAFKKILKKYDKVSHGEAGKKYVSEVRRSSFVTSDKAVRLMDQVEALFTHHFANGDRKKAFKFLRPQRRRAADHSHILTFFVGLFTGSFIALFFAYALLAHIRGMLFSPRQIRYYTEIVYPIFSMMALFSLHLFVYGCNILMWKKTRINHSYIFEFDLNTALRYGDVFLICTCLMSSIVGAMALHLFFVSTATFSPHMADLIPAILLLVYVLILICPFNIFYRSTRFYFLRLMRNIIFSPLYKVSMVDFFMADQLTSQVPMLRHMESSACYFVTRIILTKSNYEICKAGKISLEMSYVISFAPYYWRAMQCVRRWFDEMNTDHLANLGKYVSAMAAGAARLMYYSNPTTLWMVMVIITSLVAMVYQLYWDFVKDWGFLNPDSKNPWLRDQLLLKNKGIYYGSIALNLVLRVVCFRTLVRFHQGMFEYDLIEFLFASLEVIRRGHWNYYRLENEHLNNVGKFRAVVAVPLPSSEDADSDW